VHTSRKYLIGEIYEQETGYPEFQTLTNEKREWTGIGSRLKGEEQ